MLVFTALVSTERNETQISKFRQKGSKSILLPILNYKLLDFNNTLKTVRNFQDGILNFDELSKTRELKVRTKRKCLHY